MSNCPFIQEQHSGNAIELARAGQIGGISPCSSSILMNVSSQNSVSPFFQFCSIWLPALFVNKVVTFSGVESGARCHAVGEDPEGLRRGAHQPPWARRRNRNCTVVLHVCCTVIERCTVVLYMYVIYCWRKRRVGFTRRFSSDLLIHHQWERHNESTSDLIRAQESRFKLQLQRRGTPDTQRYFPLSG